jgi:hypothetical protein
MPQGVWSPKYERMYEHILTSCRSRRPRRSLATCKRIAAATVNKARTEAGVTKAIREHVCGCIRKQRRKRSTARA